MIENPVTLEEKMENIKELVHQHVPDVEVKWTTGYRKLGHFECFGGENRKGLICISKDFADANCWEVIEQIVLHEIAHALTPLHGHDQVWKAKCIQLGIPPERESPGYVVTKDQRVIKIQKKERPRRERKPDPEVYRYIEVCDKCGTLTGYGSRKTSQEYPHECGGKLQLLPNPLFNMPDYDADRIFTGMNEQLLSVIEKDENVFGIARFEYLFAGAKHNYLFVICNKTPEEDERRAMYKELEGLYEYALINAGTDPYSAASDKLTVKHYQKETYVVYAVSDDLQDYISEVLKCSRVPETEEYSIGNFFCLEEAQILFEKDDIWQKIKGLIHSCTKDVFRMICQDELRLAISEEILNSIANKKYAHITYKTIFDACKHMIKALYAVNGRFCGKIDLNDGLKITEGLEKKPEDFDLVFGSVLEKKYKSDSYPESLEKILRLSMEIDSL